MLNAAQEDALLRRNADLKQDKKDPLCINIHDGRLVPNVKNTRENPDYRIFRGDPSASTAERLASLSVGARPAVKVVASRPVIDVETFDVSTATKDELIVFALDEYSLVLEPSTHIATMRKQILAAAERAAAAQPAEDMT